MVEAKLSSKNQIVVPKAAREALGVKAGDTLLVSLHGATVVLLPKPKDHLKALRGAAKGSYGKKYLDAERKSWR